MSAPLPLQPENLPTTLTRRDQWVTWKLEPRPGETKPTKIPYDPKQPTKKAKANDPTTWATFTQALAQYKAGGFSGIGYELADDDGIVGIDLDHCRDRETGIIAPWAIAVVARFPSYAEVSPSGTGIRIFGMGTLPPGRRKVHVTAADAEPDAAIEVYDRARFLTVTGHRLTFVPAEIRDIGPELAAWHAETFPPVQLPNTPARPTEPLDLSDQELLDRMFAAANGARMRALWNGDISGYGNDHSAADFALCNALAFWTGGDADRMDRLFRQSGLYRPKWERPDYATATITNAIAGCHDFYRGQPTTSLGMRHQVEPQGGRAENQQRHQRILPRRVGSAPPVGHWCTLAARTGPSVSHATPSAGPRTNPLGPKSK